MFHKNRRDFLLAGGMAMTAQAVKKHFVQE